MTTRLCPGCRSLDGVHTFGPTCTLVETDGAPLFATPAEAVACLREALRLLGKSHALTAVTAGAALNALATTLAERDKLIAELELRLKDTQVCLGFEQVACAKAQDTADKLAEKTARVAELESGECAFLADVRDELRLKPGDGLLAAVQALKHRAELAESRTPVALDRGEAVAELAKALADFEFESPSDWARDVVKAAAERWAALQWRPAAEAPRNTVVLFRAKAETMKTAVNCLGEWCRGSETWRDRADCGDWLSSEVLGWLPLDALPALPSEPLGVPADLHQKRICESCGEDALCEFRDTTLVNANSPDGNGAWMCDECHDDLRSQP